MKLEDFDRNARSLLLRQLLEGSSTGVNYAPDTRYDSAKRCNVQGPLTLQITDVLTRRSKLWALEMREAGPMSAQEGKARWRIAMREADAEIRRLVANTKLTHGAAA